MQQETIFFSEGCKIAAQLYLPDTYSEPLPGIVLCHGFAGVKELLLPSFAQYFSQRGFAVLNFDYHGFGESEGERGRLIPLNQVRDIRNAITFLQSHKEVDPNRIALWGSSLGGANAIVTAGIDKRVKCLCVQLTFGDGYRLITGRLTSEEKVKFLDTIKKMQQKKVCSNKEMMVPIHKILSDEQSKKFYNDTVESFPALDIKMPFLTVAETLECQPEKYLKDIDIPIHITAAKNDSVNPPEESELLYAMAKEPKRLLMVDNATHYELYEGEHFQKVAYEQCNWFTQYLYSPVSN